MEMTQINKIEIVLNDGTRFSDGSGKTFQEWEDFMTWKTPAQVTITKEDGTRALVHSSKIEYIEEKIYNIL